MKRLFLMTLLASTVSMVAVANDHKADDEKKEKHGYMAKIDIDGDGLVSKAEFLKVKEDHFTKIDTDADGFLSKDEMKEARKKMKAKRAEWKAKREAKKED